MVAISGLLPIVAGAFYIGQATALPVILSDDPAPQNPTEESTDLGSLPLVLTSIIQGVEDYVPPADIQEKLKALEKYPGTSDISRQSFPGQDNPMIKPTRDSEVSEAVHLFLDEVLRSVLPLPWSEAELEEFYANDETSVRREEVTEPTTPELEEEGGDEKRGVETGEVRTIALDAAYYKVRDRFIKLLHKLRLRKQSPYLSVVAPVGGRYRRDGGGGQCGGGKCGRRDNGGGQCGGGKCGRATAEGKRGGGGCC